VELTVVMPCLNEAETVATCVHKAAAFLADNGISGEVVVADNGSTDGSRKLAEEAGARVVPIPERGYGNALMGGILAARGEYVIMGDADDSYDFTNLMPFVTELRKGYDLVMGNRFKGGIAPGAMPPLHKYLGNPLLSFIGRLFFRSPIGDFHCGLRGFRRDSAIALNLQATGMEFASEMVVKATLAKQKITEVPTPLAKDGRSRRPHLRSFRDGWRHLRFLLLFSPGWLFFVPGLLLRSPSAGCPSTWTRWSPAARASTSGSRRCSSGCSPGSTPARRGSCRPSPRCRPCSASSPWSAAC
jgi:glycosyltransferase involved in cell wall biosynthesis